MWYGAGPGSSEVRPPHPTMRRALTVFLIAAGALGVLPAAPASAGRSFTFYGSGFGHGLGMSQWGAYGLARDGWGHTRILTHFYSGTTVKQAAAPPKNVRVGLTQGQASVRLTAEAGRVTIRVEGPGSGTVVGSIPRGRTWTVRAVGDKYRVLTAAGRRVGGKDWGGTARNLYLAYTARGARVRSPDAGATYNRGSIEFNLYACGGTACSLRMILVIPPEGYLLGLGEVPSSWPLAALRSQAVAARSYAFYKVGSGQHRAGCNCGLYDSSYDQVYVGWAKEGGSLGGRWVRSVRQTDNTIVASGGDVIAAFYTSSDGGHTEDNENVWGGTPLPYLRGVCDPGDFTSANPSRIWQVRYSAATVTGRLDGYTGNIGTVTGFTDFDRGVSGRIIDVRVKGRSGSDVITGAQFRAGLGLRDDRVWVNRDKNVTGRIRETYDDENCGPGLPTTPEVDVPGGSRQKFETGAIYRNAGDVTVWLRGPVYDEYTAVGGADGTLGLPTSKVVPVTGVTGCAAGCSRTSFVNGRVWWKSGSGADALWGRVLNTFLDHDGVQGSLGFPTSRVQVGGDDSTSATFEHGSIQCPPPGAGSCTVS
jgi:SpoIID/LytB domain protein